MCPYGDVSSRAKGFETRFIVALSQSEHRSDMILLFLSSLVDKDHMSWRIRAKKTYKETSRRLRSYITAMGITGQLLLFLQLCLKHPDSRSNAAVQTFLKALPDQEVLAGQKHSGLAFPDNYDLSSYVRGDVVELLAETFAEPSFLETFFTLFPWQSLSDLDDLPFDIQFTFSLHPLKGGHAYLIRLLSFRNLPQNNSRWGDKAKLAFNTFLDKVVDKVGDFSNTFNDLVNLFCSPGSGRKGRH